MRGDFGLQDANPDDDEKKTHKEFVKTIQQCFSSKIDVQGVRDKENIDFIEDQERQYKTEQFA